MRLACLLSTVLLLTCCTASGPAAIDVPRFRTVSAEAGRDYSEVLLSASLNTTKGIKECGFFFGSEESGKAGAIEMIPADSTDGNSFFAKAGGLQYSSSYRYSAYADGGKDKIFSDWKIWTTANETPPAPEIVSITPGLGSNAGNLSIKCLLKDIASVAGKDALSCGICYSASNNEPGEADAMVTAEKIGAAGEYTIEIQALTPKTTYHFRAFAKIGQEISYSASSSVLIPSGADVVITGNCDSVGVNSAKLHGKLNLDGGQWTSVVCGFELNGTAFTASLSDDGNISKSFKDLIAQTEYSYRAFARIDGSVYYGAVKSFRTKDIPGQDVGYVDLGLSVLWATCNLGADSPEKWGDKYAWGETSVKDSYSWSNYSHCLGSEESIFKYTQSDYSDAPDGKTVLEPEDDAATVKLGSKWHTPTAEEFNELIENCKYIRTYIELEIGRCSGTMMYSKKAGYTDNCIFLPGCAYWTATLHEGHSKCAYQFYYSSWAPNLAVHNIDDPFPEEWFYRCDGNFIRPVRQR